MSVNSHVWEVVTLSAYYHLGKPCPFSLKPLWEYRKQHPESELSKTTPCTLKEINELKPIYRLDVVTAALELAHHLPLLGDPEHASYLYHIILWRCHDAQCPDEKMIRIAEGLAPSFRMALIRRWWTTHGNHNHQWLALHPWAIHGNHSLLNHPCDRFVLPTLLKLGLRPSPGKGQSKYWWHNKPKECYGLLMKYGALPPDHNPHWLELVVNDPHAKNGPVHLGMVLKRISLDYLCRNLSETNFKGMKYVYIHLLVLHDGGLPNDILRHKILPFLP
jgi:hypothetical protein